MNQVELKKWVHVTNLDVQIKAQDIAVITPYQGQKRELRRQMRIHGLHKVSVDTVDGYQVCAALETPCSIYADRQVQN